jgi:hypothetical protein
MFCKRGRPRLTSEKTIAGYCGSAARLYRGLAVRSWTTDLNFAVGQNGLSRLLASRTEVKEFITTTKKQPKFGIRPDDSDKDSNVNVGADLASAFLEHVQMTCAFVHTANVSLRSPSSC